MTTPKLPARLRHYHLDAVAGTGAFASVYRATNTNPGADQTPVAIKLIRKHDLRSQDLQDRVQQEVGIHTRLRHEHIVRLIDFGEDDDHIALVLEYAGGGSLTHYLQNLKRPLTEPEGRLFIVQLLDALEYLHRHGIAHRDLSPSNILLTTDLQVKLADFGMAKVVGGAAYPDLNLTLCGTPSFLAPEMIQKRHHGLSTDVFSLGAVAFFLLTGSAPFDVQAHNALKATLAKVAQVEYTMPGSLSSSAQDFIRQCLQAVCRIFGSLEHDDLFLHCPGHRFGCGAIA
ncbi:uncharacterized protein MONBRDRAFT_15891 [Monosiga brevicollis MX1]|uniref:Protein kinase domain-containing protein n=1 Tax=Monosiga brevicollis TaxID=81824 RepID=A9UW53_MONBE|nr:uncharacterized protein MONBRDRAFT_15891 [Monosiga brevicollis MX1]EDQ90502.1 predicted protein [Monosiga brevicollis MX1]|eukprot:XP_001744553.1 hypothetical protein [Monosiga brevicollis MX1]